MSERIATTDPQPSSTEAVDAGGRDASWPTEWLAVPDVAERLGVLVTRVHQLIRDGSLIAVRENGPIRIPADMLHDDVIVKHLPGVITLLRDARFSDEEIIRWLWTADESLPGTPVAALRANRATEVKRRAQALGF